MRLCLRDVGKRVYEVEPPGGRLGSAAGLAVSLQDKSVLAEHAEFGWDGQRWWVAQLGNKPVYLDGSPIPGKRAYLSHLGLLQVGNVAMDYWYDLGPSASDSGVSEQTLRRPIMVELQPLTLSQPQSLQGNQIPTLAQRPIVPADDPSMRTQVRPPVRATAPPTQITPPVKASPEQPVLQPIRLSPEQATLVGLISSPVQPPPPAPPPQQKTVPVAPHVPSPPPEQQAVANPRRPVQYQEAERQPSRQDVQRDWRPLIQLGVLVGVLGLMCLLAFIWGIQSVPEPRAGG